MFNYPGLKPKLIKTAEQRCVECRQWFKQPTKTVNALQKIWKTFHARPMTFVQCQTCTCTHCKEKQLLIPVGKYDRPGATKEACSVQYIVLR